MLQLLQPTSGQWVSAAVNQLDRLLADHAHCEMKAAQSALSLASRHGAEAPEIVGPLTELATEEIEHFRQVHGHADRRGIRIDPPAADDYVRALMRLARRDQQAPILLDRLLVSALIEARSCERFQLLSKRLAENELGPFYRDLMESEARHFRLFCRLAESHFGAAKARARLTLLAQYEADVAASLPLGPTVHG